MFQYCSYSSYTKSLKEHFQLSLKPKPTFARHVRVVLFPLPGLPERRGAGQERAPLLPSGLLHALHTGTAPQTGGQGEMGH